MIVCEAIRATDVIVPAVRVIWLSVNKLKLVNEPALRLAVPSVIDSDSAMLSVVSDPCDNDDTPSVVVDTLANNKRVNDPAAIDIVPSDIVRV